MSKRISSIIKICAALGDDGKGDFKRLDKMEFLDPKANKNMRESLNYEIDTDRWIRLVANDLCKILKLRSPMFLGSSLRAINSGAGAYAFSVSNDAGEFLVLKIVLEVELEPYKKIMNKYALVDEKYRFILPEIYLAKKFSELGYNPPKKDSTAKFAVVVMEELEKMPSDMVSLYFSNIIDSEEGITLFFKDKEALRSLISEYVKLYIMPMISNNTEFKDDYSAAEGPYLLNAISNNIKLYIEDILVKNIDKLFIKPGYSNFYIELTIENLSMKAIQRSLDEFSDKITIINKLKVVEDTAYEFAHTITNKLILSKIITSTPSPKRKLLSNRFDSISKVKKAIDALSDFGILAEDLHQDNIMIRPSTGDLVISDVGHFLDTNKGMERTLY